MQAYTCIRFKWSKLSKYQLNVKWSWPHIPANWSTWPFYFFHFQAGTVIWIGILVYTDPAGIRTYLAAQVSEQSPLGDPGGGGLPPHLGVAPVFRGGDPTSTLSIHRAPDPTPLPENQSQGHHGPPRAGPIPQSPPAVPQITWGEEDEEGWRRLSFRHWPSLFSYYNVTLAKRRVLLESFLLLLFVSLLFS